jgi:hypothetical protein
VSYPLRSPLLFLVFNRPDTTARVFERIRRARPPRLYVASDGPRDTREGESERVSRVRAIATAVDWPCEVKTLFHEHNLGCRTAVSGGIDWFFANEEEGIILEDDVVPDESFFRFCDELLERYRSVDTVMMISANHLHGAAYRPDSSYFFSRYMHVWGWASWRRAWSHYDVTMARWPAEKAAGFLRCTFLGDERLAAFWEANFDATHSGRIDTWDFQWVFATMLREGLAAAPAGNLARNIGFSAEATHTGDPTAFGADLPLEPLEFPLRHPREVSRDLAADAWEENHLFAPRASQIRRVRGWLNAVRSRLHSI